MSQLALPRLFATAGVILARLDDAILGVKISATMLSLTTFIKLEALNSPQLSMLVKACDLTLSTFDMPPGTSDSRYVEPTPSKTSSSFAKEAPRTIASVRVTWLGFHSGELEIEYWRTRIAGSMLRNLDSGRSMDG